MLGDLGGRYDIGIGAQTFVSKSEAVAALRESVAKFGRDSSHIADADAVVAAGWTFRDAIRGTLPAQALELMALLDDSASSRALVSV